MRVKNFFPLIAMLLATTIHSQIVINEPGRYENLVVVNDNQGSNDDYGIVVMADSVQLVGCRVSGFRYGITAYGQKNISIHGSRVSGLVAGIRMDDVIATDVCNNTVVGDGMGLIFNGSSENAIINNTITTVFDGIIFDNGSNQNSVGNNTVNVCSRNAIVVRGGSFNNYGCGNTVSGWNGTLTGDAILVGCKENGNRINEEIFAAVGKGVEVNTFALIGNFPNPFNPETTIAYAVNKSGPVKLTVYDALGRKVAVVVDSWQSAGSHQAIFNARDLTSGTYLYRLETPGFTQMKKMVLQK
jgi:parallel beta-helix repeat protein